MPNKIISEDSFSTWNINGDNKTWTLETNATITVNDEPAINVLASSTGNTLKLFGDIVTSGDDGEGVHVLGADTRIIIGANSTIESDRGIVGNANGMRVVNQGEIDAVNYGISNGFAANIRNFGEISADIGVSVTGGSKVVNGKDGSIQGDSVGVVMGFGTDGVVINHGLISGNNVAVHMFSGGENKLINTGTIQGDILFGSGDDLLDSRRGTIDGDVAGGDGNDVYKIGKNDIGIVEHADDGHDRVYSKVSHWLDDNIENLYLTGKQDISGGGNDEDNFILGNKGSNTLAGGNGDDYVGGGRGNDFLSGGDQEDFFMFNRGDDHDAVIDFTNGDDMIWMTGFEGVTTFDQLQSHMSQHGDDVWISMGQGDRLVVMNTAIGTLDESDFTFLVL